MSIYSLAFTFNNSFTHYENGNKIKFIQYHKIVTRDSNNKPVYLTCTCESLEITLFLNLNDKEMDQELYDVLI